MKNFYNLKYFERQMLIDRIRKAIAKSQGWQVDMNSNILESTEPRLHFYANSASIVIEKVEAYTEDIGEEENNSIN